MLDYWNIIYYELIKCWSIASTEYASTESASTEYDKMNSGMDESTAYLPRWCSYQLAPHTRIESKAWFWHLTPLTLHLIFRDRAFCPGFGEEILETSCTRNWLLLRCTETSQLLLISWKVKGLINTAEGLSTLQDSALRIRFSEVTRMALTLILSTSVGVLYHLLQWGWHKTSAEHFWKAWAMTRSGMD